MDQKTKNGVGLFALTMGSLGAPVPSVLQALGFIDQANSLRESLVLISSLDWNWTTIYIIVFVAAVVWLAVVNFEVAGGALRRWKKRNHAHFDTTVGAAINYIVESSVFSVGRFSEIMPHEQAMDAFVEAAYRGKIKVQGMRPGDNMHERIKPQYFKNAKLQVLRYKERGEYQITYQLVCNCEQPVVLYDGLLVDIGRVKEVWLPRKINSSWQSA